MFIEQLRRKMHIDQLVQRVVKSLAMPEEGSGIVRMDQEALRELLNEASYTPHTERDVTMFLPPSATDHQHILVFDNDIAFYRTTPEDIALRKSPTLKEMISIRNAIRILHDKDVVVSRRDASLVVLRREVLGQLDLTFTAKDLEDLAHDGLLALEQAYVEGVMDTLDLFAELLGYTPPPAAFQFQHYMVVGALQYDQAGMPAYGPMVLYQRIHNLLKLIDIPISKSDAAAMEALKQIVLGKTTAAVEGSEVFDRLRGYVCEAYEGNYRIDIDKESKIKHV